MEPRSPRRQAPPSHRAFAWAVAAALVLGTVTTLQTIVQQRVTGRIDPALRAVSGNMSYWILWAILTPVIGRAWRSVHLASASVTVKAVAYALSALVFAVCHSALLYLWQRNTGLTDLVVPLWHGMLVVSQARLVLNLVVYGSIVGLFAATDATWKSRNQELALARLGAQLAEARLGALRMQLNPHFLFNTLNTVTMSVRRGAGDEAIRVVAALGDLLRAVLAEPQRQTVSLREELAMVERYLAIERARFGDRLQVSVAADPDTLDLPVPTLAVQHLVENAMHHGISARPDSGRLEVRARRDDGALVIEVTDDGVGLDASSQVEAGSGGLTHMVDRLALLYGTDFDFELRNGPLGAIATLRIPSSGAERVRPARDLATPEARS